MKLTLLLLCVAGSAARPQYADLIPNGKSVPHPGPQGGIWAGVGHENAAGGGPLNPFGEAFMANGFEWTTALCEADSDGDGRANGVELGDPNCEWEVGAEPAEPSLSHPGIADIPREAAATSECDSYVAPDDELVWDIVFSQPAAMDESQTHYICEQQLVEVPAKEILHKIKHGVILDNSNVLHHMFVFICPADSNSTDGYKVGEGAYQCSGNESGCRRVGGWAVGPHESCEPPNVGIELDFSEMDNVIIKIEAHYDNTLGVPQEDQSGIRLHLTPTLRPLTGSGVILGKPALAADFFVPAQSDSYPLEGVCPTAVTEMMDHPVYVYAFTPHMHYYGRTLVTEHWRCGEKIGELGRILQYEFDNQQGYALDPPIKLLPGDSLVTTCSYNTSQVDFNVTGGDETTDEMCLNFISVYPTPGTVAVPDLLSVCFSAEEGFKTPNGQFIPANVAFGDQDRLTVTTDFTTDPEQNIAECCVVDNCNDIYLAEVNQACGVDSDCEDGLTCNGGLCEGDSDSEISMPQDEKGESPLSEDEVMVEEKESGSIYLSVALPLLLTFFSALSN